MFQKRLSSVLAFLIVAVPALAGPLTSVVVYGDSLSDNGNLFHDTGQPPSPPYFGGRRSNGPVAVELLAQDLGVPLVDFAYIGATTGIGNYGDGGTPTSFGFFHLPGMTTIFSDPSKSPVPYIPGALFVVWTGPNDFLAPSPLDTTPQEILARSITNLVTIAGTLRALGASHILVPGMPDIGLTPYYQSLGPVAAAQGSALTDAFNAALQANLPAGVQYFDSSALLHAIVANPAAFGLTNVTDPCLVGMTVCSDPGKYLFWDEFHPTAATHALIAEGFAEAVPEPATILLIFAGVAPLEVARRIRIKRDKSRCTYPSPIV